MFKRLHDLSSVCVKELFVEQNRCTLCKVCVVYFTWHCCTNTSINWLDYTFFSTVFPLSFVVVVVFFLSKWNSIRFHELTHCIRAKSNVGKVPMNCVMSFRYINYTFGLINSTCKWFVANMDMDTKYTAFYSISNWTFSHVCVCLTRWQSRVLCWTITFHATAHSIPF